MPRTISHCNGCKFLVNVTCLKGFLVVKTFSTLEVIRLDSLARVIVCKEKEYGKADNDNTARRI